MSWLFSRALVEAFSEATCSDGAASALSSGTPTPRAYLPPDKTTDFSRPSRFGMTFGPLTDDLGAELLTWFLAASRARTSAPQGGVQDWTANAPACGPKWQGSLARYDRDSRSWKTAQCSLLGDSDEFSETWPKWGTTRDGELFLLPTPALRIGGSESGLWQTPVADDAVERKAGKWNSRGEPKLSAEVKLWPTPNAWDWKGPPGRGCMDRGGRQASLPAVVKQWPTPTASLGTKGGRVTPRKAREGGTLIEAVSHRQTWPTPVASMAKGSSPAALTRKSGSSRENDRLDHKVMALDGGQLNPTWVEWLMGWPLGWTDLKPLETDRCRTPQSLRGAA